MSSPLEFLPATIARLLAIFFELWPSYGGAVTLTTGAILTLLTPVIVRGMRRQIVASRAMQQLKPGLDDIRRRHADDAQRRQRETAAFLAKHDVTPLSAFGGCIHLALQSPFLIALFHVLRGLGHVTDGVADPRYLPAGSALRDAVVADNGRLLSLGLDLAASPAAAIGAGLATALPALALLGLLLAVALAHAALSRPADGTTNPVVWITALVSPLFALVMPAGIGLYSLMAAVWRLGQQRYVRQTAPAG